MKDMSIAGGILEIKISKTSSGLELSKSRYTKTIVRKFNQYEDSFIKTPIGPNSHKYQSNYILIRIFSYNQQSNICHELYMTTQNIKVDKMNILETKLEKIVGR